MVYPEKEIYWKNESGTKDQNNELLGLECSTIQKRCGRRHIQTKKDQKPLKCGYGEEWKRSAGLIKLLMRKF